MKLIDILFTGKTPRQLKKGKRERVQCFLCQRYQGTSSVNILQRSDGAKPEVRTPKLRVQQFVLNAPGLTIRFMACQECNFILRILRGSEPGVDPERFLVQN
jgi:hypothetical protein